MSKRADPLFEFFTLQKSPYLELIQKCQQPARAVGVDRLVANSAEVEGQDVQPADLAFYTPTGQRKPSHVAIILDTDDNSVIFAHSGSIDPEIEIGGVEIFPLPRGNVFNQSLKHGPRGTVAIRRLSALAS